MHLRLMNRLPMVLLALSVWVGLSGCASVTGEGSRQTVLVRSNPPGASIYVEGLRVGQTPELVEIRRSFSPKIQILEAKGRRNVELETRYRWGRSFGRGLVFVTYAPISWLIDVLTGTAWDAQEAEPIPVKLAEIDLKNPKPQHRPLIAVIAPPRSSSTSMSDSAGRALEASLREGALGERYDVRPYDETLTSFVQGDYEYQTMNLSRKRRLLKNLSADYVFESKIEKTDGGWKLESEGNEILGKDVKPGPTITLSRDTMGPRVFGMGFGLRPWWSRILPDTIGIDFVNEAMNVEVQGKEYSLSPVHGDEWWSQGIRYASAINISSTPDRRREYGSRWELGAVPNFRFSHKLLKASDLPPPVSGGFVEKDPQFSRMAISGGYGLEVGYLIGRHFIYLDVIPFLNWGQISWRQDFKDRTATRVSIGALTELGYNYLFDSNWMIRIFSRSSAEDIELWQDAFVARLGVEYKPTTALGITSGLTIGYRFDVEGYKAKEGL